MRGDIRRSRLGAGWSWTLGASVVALLAALGLLAAGCGGGSPSPAVANLGTTTAAATAAGAPSTSASEKAATGLAFSACMRSHGVPSFPDLGQGGLSPSALQRIDPRSPLFLTAVRACMKLLPNGGVPTPTEAAQADQLLLKFSLCMRKHGVADFPEPTVSNGIPRFSLPGGFDKSAPQFQVAAAACISTLTGGKSIPGIP